MLAVGDALPPLRRPAQAMGCLHVLEGATPGGLVIGRHMRRTRGLTPGVGAGFFHGNGARIAEMCGGFRGALAGFAANLATADAVVASANGAFRSLRHCCLHARAPGVPAGRANGP